MQNGPIEEYVVRTEIESVTRECYLLSWSTSFSHLDFKSPFWNQMKSICPYKQLFLFCHVKLFSFFFFRFLCEPRQKFSVGKPKIKVLNPYMQHTIIRRLGFEFSFFKTSLIFLVCSVFQTLYLTFRKPS